MDLDIDDTPSMLAAATLFYVLASDVSFLFTILQLFNNQTLHELDAKKTLHE